MTGKKIPVIEMPRASLLEDGSLVELEFKSDDGQPVTLQFYPDDLERWAAVSMELIREAQNRRRASDRCYARLWPDHPLTSG